MKSVEDNNNNKQKQETCCARCDEPLNKKDRYFITMNHEKSDSPGLSADLATTPDYCIECAKQIINEIVGLRIVEWKDNHLTHVKRQEQQHQQ
jgi:hypothetical protein